MASPHPSLPFQDHTTNQLAIRLRNRKKHSVKQKSVYPPFNCILEVWLTDCAIIQENSGAGAVFPCYLSWRMLENNGNKKMTIKQGSKFFQRIKCETRPQRKNVLARNGNMTSKKSTNTLSSYNEIPCSSTYKSHYHCSQSQTSFHQENSAFLQLSIKECGAESEKTTCPGACAKQEVHCSLHQ